jgi:hypothetical protein
MSTRKFSNSSAINGEKAIAFTGEPGVPTDAADAYYANLKMWIRGGYNGATAGNITAGSGTLDIPSWNGATSTLNTIATVQRVDSNAGSSPINSAANRFIKDGKAGNTAQLRNDKLGLYFNGSSNPIIWKALDATTWNNSTTNRTFAYWAKWDNVAANTSVNVITPTFHSWAGTNAVALVAHDWYTQGTGNMQMILYANGADMGSFTMPNLPGQSNGKGIWFHFAVVHTSSSTKVYVNGQEQTFTYSAVTTWPSVGSSQSMSWNSRADGISGGVPGNYVTGSTCVRTLADIRYYDTNLSSDAIFALYSKAKVYYN